VKPVDPAKPVPPRPHHRLCNQRHSTIINIRFSIALCSAKFQAHRYRTPFTRSSPPYPEAFRLHCGRKSIYRLRFDLFAYLRGSAILGISQGSLRRASKGLIICLIHAG
jgi:hypothetical protein